MNWSISDTQAWSWNKKQRQKDTANIAYNHCILDNKPWEEVSCVLCKEPLYCNLYTSAGSNLQPVCEVVWWVLCTELCVLCYMTSDNTLQCVFWYKERGMCSVLCIKDVTWTPNLCGTCKEESVFFYIYNTWQQILINLILVKNHLCYFTFMAHMLVCYRCTNLSKSQTSHTGV